MELMVVVAIIGLLILGTTLAFNNILKSNLRSAASRTASSMRYAFDRAMMTGRYIRLAMDLEKGEIWLEGSEDRVALKIGKAHAEDEEDEEKEGSSEKSKPAKKKKAKSNPMLSFFGLGGGDEEDSAEDADAQESMIAEDMQALVKDWEEDQAPVGSAKPQFTVLKDWRMKKKKKITFNAKVSIVDVTTPRTVEPVEEGRAYVYFFPQGHSEPAIVHFVDRKKGEEPDDDDQYYSVVLHPLTGEAKVYPCFYEIPSDFGASDDKKERPKHGVCREERL